MIFFFLFSIFGSIFFLSIIDGGMIFDFFPRRIVRKTLGSDLFQEFKDSGEDSYTYWVGQMMPKWFKPLWCVTCCQVWFYLPSLFLLKPELWWVGFWLLGLVVSNYLTRLFWRLLL